MAEQRPPLRRTPTGLLERIIAGQPNWSAEGMAGSLVASWLAEVDAADTPPPPRQLTAAERARNDRQAAARKQGRQHLTGIRQPKLRLAARMVQPNAHKAPAIIFLDGLIEAGGTFSPKALADEIKLHGGAREPVKLFINSTGGLVSLAIACAAILTMRHEAMVHAHVDGVCNSAALIVFASADKRTCDHDATFKFHDTAFDKRPTADAMRHELAQMDNEATDADLLIAVGCGVPVARIRELNSWQATLNAVEAQELGLVDEITYPS